MSAQPGWYPDPSGQPGSFRYWDGTRWTDATTAEAARQGAGASGPEGSTAGSAARIAGGDAPEGRRRTGWIVAGVVLVAIVVLIVWLLQQPGGSGPRPNPRPGDTSSPTISAWDERTPSARPSPTPTPTPTPAPAPAPTPSKGREMEM